ncbi:hypothetical protein TNCV_2578751 [Trichonephila clavipes]|nr:hypothetical protein TNCV_2578751 [Trichonephila clavipes]
MMDRISICETLAKRNEIDPFLKRMAIGMRNGSHTTILCEKTSWSKCGEAAQTCQQLDGLELAIDQKWLTKEALCSIKTTPGHTTVVTHQNLWELG